MRDDMGFIVRPVVQVGEVPGPPRPGCPAPERLTAETYRALRNAAPLSLPDLAAILSDRAPFDLEPNDDPRQVQDWQQVLERLEAAVERGELPRTPTLKEGVMWALKVGMPMANQPLLMEVVAAMDSASKAILAPSRRADHDPDLQQLADDLATTIKAREKCVPKKNRIATELKRTYGLIVSVESILRRIRNKHW